jgi:ribonuclease Z
MHEYMELVFLGTGASWPTASRNTAALAVKRGDEVLLFDCGEGTQRQFQRSKLSYMETSTIFVTHLHADHYLGLPGLVQTMDLNDREAPLEVYGPPGSGKMLEPLLRLGGRRSFDVSVTELVDGDVVTFDGYEVRVRELVHTDTNFGYALEEDPRPGRFDKERALELGVPEGPLFSELQEGTAVETPEGDIVTPDQVLGPDRRGRKVVYTGDVQPCEATVELAEGADVLVHEATYASDFGDANEYGHSTAQQAAYIAKRAGVKELLLTHVSPRYDDPSPLEEEAREVFPDSQVAEDLQEHVVTFPDETVE